ncbi:DUF47 domain-containing protein [Patescibacteria group bacterium]
MFRWSGWKKRDKEFEAIFRKQIALTTKSADSLSLFFENLSEPEQHIQNIIECEHASGELRNGMDELLDNTFITKLDKSDIIDLVDRIDHILNMMKGIAKRTRAYRITEGKEEAICFVSIIIEMAKILQHLIEKLPHYNLAETKKGAEKLQAFEREADSLLYEKAIPRLSDYKVDALLFRQWERIFDGLETITDICKKVGDMILSIVRKEAK